MPHLRIVRGLSRSLLQRAFDRTLGTISPEPSSSNSTSGFCCFKARVLALLLLLLLLRKKLNHLWVKGAINWAMTAWNRFCEY
jgi:hypothetical protein